MSPAYDLGTFREKLPTFTFPSRLPSSQTILLAEDDVMIRNLLRGFLQRRTYQVLVASNGNEALQLSQMHSGIIDLFLTDVEMPFLDGVSAYRQISVQRPMIKALFMSGAPIPQTLPQSSAFLHKPFEMSFLLMQVEDVLAQEAAAERYSSSPVLTMDR